MAHRFLHTLVFSSVLTLEACSISRPIDPPVEVSETDAQIPMDADPDVIAWGDPDAGEHPDAGDGSDAPAHDAWVARDAGTPDSDAGTEAGLDADLDAGDPRFCEPGWPTTKATICETIEGEDGSTWVECRNSFEDEPCILGEER